jgi:hypothetical protein
MIYLRFRDHVDTEPFLKGNLWKMLLGAVNDWFDDDEDGMAEGNGNVNSFTHTSVTPSPGLQLLLRPRYSDSTKTALDGC